MNRFVRILVGMFAVAVGSTGCGGDNDSSEVPAGVTSTVDGLTIAINTYDTEAFLAHTTEDFTWQTTAGVTSRSDFVDHFEANYETLDFHIESTGALTAERDGDAYVAEEPGRVTSTVYNEDGRSVYRLVEEDGSWLVREFRWYEGAATE